MRFVFRLVLSSTLATLPFSLWSQRGKEVRAGAEMDSLPDAPQPAQAIAGDSGSQAATTQESSSAPAAQTPTAEKSQQSEEQLKEQEHQRVAGVMATFNTTANRNAPPLSSRQKFALFFRGEADPWPFALAAAISGVGQADDSYPEWGQGLKGYAKRYGAAYSDSFIGNFFGNALLPAMLKEDPRYFQMGSGTKMKRFFWAASSTVWCRRDKGTWGPNYANLGGNLIGAAISRAYYPDSERDVGSTIADGLTVSAEGIVGSEIIEFWPDIARALKKKHDAKQARKAAAADSAQERE